MRSQFSRRSVEVRVFLLVRNPIEVQSIIDIIQKPEDGALVVFEGVVRNNANEKNVRFLEYEAYESMALKKIEEIGSQARKDFDIRDIAIVHRLGHMEIGECSIIIVVASAHRGSAFDACRYSIDTIKQIVPIWKKEFYEDGEVWIEGAK
jgi:molybdopterin synthase catalytic subunit